MSRAEDNEDTGSRLMKAVEAIGISPRDARALVANYRRSANRAHPSKSKHAQQEIVANLLIGRFAKLAATAGGATALSGVIPGLGTIVAALGGGLADAALVIKLQADLCLCLAHLFEYDIDDPTARHLAYMISLGSTLNQAGAGFGAQVASKAGVKLLKQYLKGAALEFVKQLFKRVGLIFTRKALEKALPFGIGVVIGSSANYALVRYVGGQAREWFTIDRDEQEVA